MMYRFWVMFLLMSTSAVISQETLIDENYLEDQFYVGFIKDIPLNDARNIGLGIGLGYAVNSYYSNLVVQEANTGFSYTVFEDNNDFRRNKLENHLIELPLEFRWRTSNAESTKFWRVYTGVKFGYAFGNRSKLVLEESKSSFFNTDARDIQTGLTLSFGYNTFNIHAYYGFNSLLNDGISTTTGDAVSFRPLRLGIIFYIL